MEAYQTLECEWAGWNDLDPEGMVVCSSGTSALHLACEAMRDNGKYIVVPDFTMVACARAVTLAGRDPVFIDCDDTLNMDTNLLHQFGSDLKNNVHGHCSAVMAVHVYGRRCNMNEVVNFGSNYGVRIIEDSAEAHGVRPHLMTDAMCTSFYRNKIVAGEEGGAVWFRNPQHAALARSLRSLGFTEAHDFDHIPRGHNYRMSNAHAELVLQSLAVCGRSMFVGGNLYKRRQSEMWYNNLCPSSWQLPSRQVPWVYDLRIPGLARQRQAEIVKALNKAGIGARMSFLPMSLQKEFCHCRQVAAEGFSRAVIASEQVFYLPLTPGQVTEASVVKAFGIIQQFFPEGA